MEKIKVAVTGLGHAANDFHIPCLSKFNDVELYLCDAWEEPLKAGQKLWNVPDSRAFRGQSEMLKTVRPDAVYVLLPQYTHVGRAASPYEGYVNEAIEYGAPIFVEKPLGLNGGQARRIADASKKRRISTTMCGFQQRFNPLMRHALGLIRKRGPLLGCNFCFFKSINKDEGYFIVDHNYLTFVLIHGLDLACWVPGGNIVDLASSKHKSPGIRSWSVFDAMLSFDNGITSHFSGNVKAGGRMLRFELHGPGISIFITTVSSNHELAGEQTNGFEMIALVYCSELDEPNDRLHEPEILTSSQVAPVQDHLGLAGFWGQSRHFIDCVKAKLHTDTSFESSVKSIEICDRILKSGNSF